jgi:hypothetical protein
LYDKNCQAAKMAGDLQNAKIYLMSQAIGIPIYFA